MLFVFSLFFLCQFFKSSSESIRICQGRKVVWYLTCLNLIFVVLPPKGGVWKCEVLCIHVAVDFVYYVLMPCWMYFRFLIHWFCQAFSNRRICKLTHFGRKRNKKRKKENLPISNCILLLQLCFLFLCMKVIGCVSAPFAIHCHINRPFLFSFLKYFSLIIFMFWESVICIDRREHIQVWSTNLFSNIKAFFGFKIPTKHGLSFTMLFFCIFLALTQESRKICLDANEDEVYRKWILPEYSSTFNQAKYCRLVVTNRLFFIYRK